jgi:hypothetical protein
MMGGQTIADCIKRRESDSVDAPVAGAIPPRERVEGLPTFMNLSG